MQEQVGGAVLKIKKIVQYLKFYDKIMVFFSNLHFFDFFTALSVIE